MRRAIFMVVMMALVLVLSSAYAQDVNLSAGVYSKFLTNFGLITLDGPVTVDGVTISHKGFRVGAYLVAGLGEKLEGTIGNEVDLVAAYNRNVYLGNFFKEVNIDLGVVYYDFAAPSLWNADGDYIEPFVELRRLIRINNDQTLVPIFRFEAPIALNDGVSGSHTYVGLGHEWKIFPGLTFSHNANAVWDSGAYGLEQGCLFLYRANIAYNIGDWITISPSVKVTTPLKGAGDRKTEVSAGGGLMFNYKF